MTLLQLVVIALVQGVTEFLPVSSSGHLRLLALFGGWPDRGLAIDVAVHVGTLLAVVVYLRRECAAMAAGLLRLRAGLADPGVRLLAHLGLATVPVVAAGGLAVLWFGSGWRNSLPLIAWATLGFGVALHLADRLGAARRTLAEMGRASALAIGLAQMLALIPGASRAGVTITAARALGYGRRDAARFSMLLSIPAIAAAGALAAWELGAAADAALRAEALAAAGLAFAAALAAIAAMMGWLARATFTPFVVYRVLLGGALLAVCYL